MLFAVCYELWILFLEMLLNIPAETIEDHYRRNLAIPLVDHLINELRNQTRLSQTRLTGLVLRHISSHSLLHGHWLWRNSSQICKASSKEDGTGKWYCLTDSKSQERALKVVKIEKFPGKTCPQTPLGACAFSARFAVNRSTVFLDPHLITVLVSNK